MWAESEQMLYEIGDPQAYLLPDVACDFAQVTIEKPRPIRCAWPMQRHNAADSYKVCATFADGFRAGTMMSFVGIDAAAKARHFADAAFARARTVLRQHNLADYGETSVEVLGDDSQFGDAGQNPASREVVLKIAAKHETQAGCGALLKISGELAAGRTFDFLPVRALSRRLSCACFVPVAERRGED